jgi:hypothetical protein
VPARVIGKSLTEPAIRHARIVHNARRHWDRKHPFRQHGNRTALDRMVREMMSVVFGSNHGDEQVARLANPRVTTTRLDAQLVLSVEPAVGQDVAEANASNFRIRKGALHESKASLP